MEAQQISKINGIHRRGAKGSVTNVSHGKLNGNSGALAKEISIKKVEEAGSWQDKMKESHLNDVSLRSETLQKRVMRQTSSKTSLYEKNKPVHYFSTPLVNNGLRAVYTGRAI